MVLVLLYLVFRLGFVPCGSKKIFFVDSIFREPFKTDGDTDSKNIS